MARIRPCEIDLNYRELIALKNSDKCCSVPAQKGFDPQDIEDEYFDVEKEDSDDSTVQDTESDRSEDERDYE